jgi:hypothetical protein
MCYQVYFPLLFLYVPFVTLLFVRQVASCFALIDFLCAAVADLVRVLTVLLRFPWKRIVRQGDFRTDKLS